MGVCQFISSSIFLSSFSLLIIFILFFSGGCNIINGLFLVESNLFIFDSLAFYLSILVILLGTFSIFCFSSLISWHTKGFLFMSLFFSGLCFCVNHVVLFWCFYELSMLPLLFLIFKDSPYSERFIAGWYFAVYLIITSLPLILCLLYLVSVNDSVYFSNWQSGIAPMSLYILLSFIFFTKVPLSPFHTWLPIVHAEATSIVSIFLSGYIMKLGLLGVYRCSSFLFSGDFYVYLFFCCLFSVLFIVTACSELDGKRWLAFLSLSHIVIGFLCFYICDWETISLSFIYCLGHGLSAGLVFGVLWLFYDVTGSRNWILLKEGVSSKGIIFAIIFSLLSLCSFPPTLQFFCEVNLLGQSSFSLFILLFWCFYLFLGGLIPLTLCGCTLIRVQGTEASLFSSLSFLTYFFILILWCYLGVLLL
uniref:NADH-ubiquinone oxidoreductase chain 4 n=3 Tax=unclassified Rhinebothroides TaxID=2627538 RepID=A0A8K1SXR5_9CEST|nr:NADH dehydrogenase subunit 4 [Rhinebothroides sp. MZUSP 8027]UFQ88942.1 NADH dehydrogenase subunit 4 [Rhinebothroides sp. MZUSP 8028]UFQ88954.1 NADH dehydrogenase subunit 4 [Rhinebothroides sp. MZUSP 8029]